MYKISKNSFRRHPRGSTALKGLLLAGIAAVAVPAAAHHSYGMFDLQHDKTVTGTIVTFDWTNPHVWIHAMVHDANGTSNTWDLELGPPVSLTQRGWKRSSLKPGDVVELTLSPLKTGAPGGHLQQVKLSDGQVLVDSFKMLVGKENAAAAATGEAPPPQPPQ